MENSKSEFVYLKADSTVALWRAAFSHTHDIMILSMLVSDLLGILTAVALAVLVRAIFMEPLVPLSFVWVPAYVVVFILSASMRGLYPAVGMSAVEQFRHLTLATSTLFLVIVAATFFFQVSTVFSRLLLALSWLFCLVTVPFNRTIVRHLISKTGLWGDPVAIVGRAAGALRVVNYFKRYPKVGLRPEVLITIPTEIARQDTDSRARLVQRMRRLRESTPLNTVVIIYDRMDEFVSIREAFRDIFEKVILVSCNETGVDLGGVNVRQYGDLLTFEIRHSLVGRFAQFEKRVIDLCVAGFGLVVLSPLLALISLSIILDSSGGIFYRQRRLGKNGREFDMLKFRTMHHNADAVLHYVLESNPEQKREWDCYQKLRNDPRITRVGHLLRRFSLDEFPQLINVLLGEMSIVGPRPIMVSQREMYGLNYRHYVRVVPGITGLWQISGRNHTSFVQRTEFDFQYINNWTIWSDIYILVRTVWVVLRRDGAC